MREVVQPSSGVAIRGPIVAHESVDHNVELGLTLIAFGWRAHERVNKTMLRHQQQDDFLLSTTLRRLDYRKIPSRFLEPKRRTIEGRITSAFSGRQAVPAADRQQSCSPKTKRGGSRRILSTGVFRVVPHAARWSGGPRHALVLWIGPTRRASPGRGRQALLIC
jgi:hypothetical protein